MRASVLLFLLIGGACCAENAVKDIEEAAVVDREEVENSAAEAEDVKETEPHRPAIHLPSIPSFQIVPQIQFPGLHFPPIPLPQLPSLPQFSLPQLPSLPNFPRPFKRETVYKTKTVHIEHTHRVTRHPVCVTAFVPKPPCLFDHEVKDFNEERDLDDIVAAQREHEIQPTIIVKELPVATRVVGVEELENSESDFDNEAVANGEDQVATFRQARYLVAHPQPGEAKPTKGDPSKTPTEPLPAESVGQKVKPDYEEHVQVSGHGHGHPIIPGHHGPGVVGLDGGVHHDDLLHDGAHHGENHEVVNGLLKVTHFVTKTILVTNVQKVIDHQVTATLIAKNCVPSEYIIPHCEKSHGVFKNNEEGTEIEGVDPRENDDDDDDENDDQRAMEDDELAEQQ